MTRTPVAKLLLFGATGDLARRMLLPSLYNLHADGLLPETLQIIGSARSDLDDAGFRDMARKALDEFLPDDRKDEAKLAAFAERLRFQPADLSDPNGFQPRPAKGGDGWGGPGGDAPGPVSHRPRIEPRRGSFDRRRLPLGGPRTRSSRA